MTAATVVREIARWLPLAWQMRAVFEGDRRKARRALRAWELAKRAERDRRMRR